MTARLNYAGVYGADPQGNEGYWASRNAERKLCCDCHGEPTCVMHDAFDCAICADEDFLAQGPECDADLDGVHCRAPATHVRRFEGLAYVFCAEHAD